MNNSKTLGQIQQEHKAWVLHNFGERSSWQPLLGMQEEVGEISHAYLKRHQGIRGTTEEHKAAIADGIADLLIYAIDFATAEGVNVETVLSETWDLVKQRDWKAFPKNGLTA